MFFSIPTLWTVYDRSEEIELAEKLFKSGHYKKLILI